MTEHQILNGAYGPPLLQAISNWQLGGERKQNLRRGQALKDVCSKLPKQFRECNLVCHRQIALPKGGVWDLIGEGKLSEKISSWTVDLEVAKDFKGGVPPEGQGYQAVIFSRLPAPDSVILNLSTLFHDADFQRAIVAYRDQIERFAAGLGRYMDIQREVVLEIDTLTQDDIYSLGGHSSPFEELVEIAARAMYGRIPTLAERDQLLLKSEHIRKHAGPCWLSPEATRRVLQRTQPHAETLSKIKKVRDTRKSS